MSLRWLVAPTGGDGGSGESRNVDIRPNPQRLDTMVGKIVRIIPDLSLHTATSTVSENGRRFNPGGCTVVDCVSPEGTFGITSVPADDGELFWRDR